jgi:hypothetical protein
MLFMAISKVHAPPDEQQAWSLDGHGWSLFQERKNSTDFFSFFVPWVPHGIHPLQYRSSLNILWVHSFPSQRTWKLFSPTWNETKEKVAKWHRTMLQ